MQLGAFVFLGRARLKTGWQSEDWWHASTAWRLQWEDAGGGRWEEGEREEQRWVLFCFSSAVTVGLGLGARRWRKSHLTEVEVASLQLSAVAHARMEPPKQLVRCRIPDILAENVLRMRRDSCVNAPRHKASSLSQKNCKSYCCLGLDAAKRSNLSTPDTDIDK